jgi:hypothetical protein
MRLYEARSLECDINLWQFPYQDFSARTANVKECLRDGVLDSDLSYAPKLFKDGLFFISR